MSTRESKYEMWRDDKEQWHWRFKAANGEEIATGQGYTTRQNCLKALSLLQNSKRSKIYSLSAPRNRAGFKG